MQKFNLGDYVQEIRTVGLDKFVMNLATMKEHFGNNPQLNFHELGQQWNRLSSEERNQQKAAVEKLLTRSSRTPREV